MGYSIYIGEASFETGLEYGDNDIYITVKEIESEDAPYWEGEDISGKTNGRHPSYTAFSRFCDLGGVRDLFFNEQHGLMRSHPGEVVLQKKDYETIKNARIEYQQNNPEAVAGWSEDKDDILARLIWFEYWFKWALDNCKMPIIKNS